MHVVMKKHESLTGDFFILLKYRCSELLKRNFRWLHFRRESSELLEVDNTLAGASENASHPREGGKRRRMWGGWALQWKHTL